MDEQNIKGAIDAIIAFLIFFGVAKVTLGKRFEGRGGRAIIIGIGLALSTGFLLMEKTLNFSLRSRHSSVVLQLCCFLMMISLRMKPARK